MTILLFMYPVVKRQSLFCQVIQTNCATGSPIDWWMKRVLEMPNLWWALKWHCISKCTRHWLYHHGSSDDHSEVDVIVRQVFRDAGYDESWLSADSLRIDHDLRLEELDDDLRGLRSISDDQAICVGYAGGTLEDRYLPKAHRLAYLAGQTCLPFVINMDWDRMVR